MPSYEVGPLLVEVNGEIIKVKNIGGEPCTINELRIEYVYTVTLPDGRNVRRRGSELIIQQRVINPKEEITSNFEVPIAGFKIIFVCGNELFEKEIEIS